jgi:hypothetical protein
MAQQQNIHDCMVACWECRDTAQDVLVNHCLAMGGAHVEQAHVKLMLDCIQITQTCADFLRRQSAQHALVCQTCAEVCAACADSCEQVGGPEMQRCATACRQCADACRGMGQQQRMAA